MTQPDADLRDRIAELEAVNARMRHELEVMYGGAFDTLKPAPDQRAAVLLEAAAFVQSGRTPYNTEAAEAALKNGGPYALIACVQLAVAEYLRRLAGEGQQDEADAATAEHPTVDGIRHLCHTGDHYCETRQDPAAGGEEPCGKPGHHAHPGFTCAEVDQTRPFWDGYWASTAPARSGQPGTDGEA